MHLRHQNMGVETADKTCERDQTVDNLIAVRQKSGSLSWLGSHRGSDSHTSERNNFRHCFHHADDDHPYNITPVGGQISWPRAGSHPIIRSLEQGSKRERGLWSSNKKSVNTMARMLAAVNSVIPMTSKCYSFPDLVRKSDRGMRSQNSERGGIEKESLFTPDRLAMEALTTFRR